MGSLDSKFRTYCIGVVSEDKELGSKVIKVYPQEHLNSIDGDISKVDLINRQVKDSTGKAYNINVDVSNTIKAIWYNPDSNRVTAPDVVSGEMVRVYTYGDNDKFYWRTMNNELDLRKHEHVEWVFVNTDQQVESNDTNTYKQVVSTKNKIVGLRTAANDGEATTYEKILDTKEGIDVLVRDGFGNYIELTSKEGKLVINTNTDVEINTTNAVVNASATCTINTGQMTIKSDQCSINP